MLKHLLAESEKRYVKKHVILNDDCLLLMLEYPAYA